MKKLYISPSKENLVTFEISNLLKEYLKKDDIDVYITDEDLTNRSYEAEELMSDIYLCIRVFESKNYKGWIFGNEKNANWIQTLPMGKVRGRIH